MTSSDTNNARAGGSWIGILLFAFALSLLAPLRGAGGATASPIAGGVLDGFVNPVRRRRSTSTATARSGTFRRQPADHQHQLLRRNRARPTSAGWSSSTTSCTRATWRATPSQGNTIWFVNGSSTGIHANCQNLLIPVEKIDKQNPAGQTTATIGVPFTYKLTIPVLFDPATGTVINYTGSLNDLHSITVIGRPQRHGRRISRYVSHTAYLARAAARRCRIRFPTSAACSPSTTSRSSRPGEQFVIELTVVLNDTPANALGTQFVNTAKWDFGRLIDGVFYEPLPGEWGISPPLTIAGTGARRHEVGPGDDEPGTVGQLRPRRPEHRAQRRLERHAPRPAAGRRDGRHVRSDAARS